MQNKCLGIIIFLLSDMLLSSCVESVDNHRTWKFDEQTFLDASSDWVKCALKDYTFSYMFWTSMPNAIVGDVTVDNSVGTVKLTLGTIWTSEDTEYEDWLKHYKDIYRSRSIELSSIEEVFKLIADSVTLAKTRFDNKELDYYEMKVEYDEAYHYPTKIIETISKSDNDLPDEVDGDWSGDLLVQIKNFQKK